MRHTPPGLTLTIKRTCPRLTTTPTTPALYRLGRHPRRPDHHALLTTEGTLQKTFAIDAMRAEIAAALTRSGVVLHDDETVTRAADAAPSRGGILSGLAVASAAVMIAAPAGAAQHPDAALLAACARFERLEATYRASCDGDAAAERNELVEPAEIAGYVTRLDLLGNCLCEQSDELSAALRLEGVRVSLG